MAACRYCGKVHSDWLGCDEAVGLGMVESLPVVSSAEKSGVLEGKTLDVVSKPKFDRVAAMAHARMFRKKK
jgi:hypothetical protein